MTSSGSPSPLLSRPGAVDADAPDAGVAAHYGTIAKEQRALLAGQSVVDLSNRDVFTISGPDRLTWLHALTTQHLESLAPGVDTEILLLSPQGRIEHGFAGYDDGETFWAHAEPGAAASLIEFLERMKFMSRVELNVVDDRVVIGRIVDGELRYQLIARDALADQAELSGLWAWEALRIEAGIPRIGLDTDDRTIPNEVGLLGRAVHLDKGCYRGQETVARVHTLGRPPRRLVRLLLDGSAEHLPTHGAEIVDGEKVVGVVGSSARHHELGPIALGIVKRSVDVSTTLLVDGVAAAQEVIVDPEIGLHVRPTVGR